MDGVNWMRFTQETMLIVFGLFLNFLGGVALPSHLLFGILFNREQTPNDAEKALGGVFML